MLWAAPLLVGARRSRVRAARRERAQPAPNPPLALEFWHNKAQPEGQDVTTIVTRYNATFAPTKVAEIFQGNGATLLTKLKVGACAATPDVTYGFGSWMPSFAEQGALVLAEDQIKRLGGIKKEDFFPTLISAQTWKGKLQALPYGTGSKGYYVRPEIVKRENVAGPPTWEEFDGFASRVTREEQYALGMSATDASWFQLLLGQRGARCSRRPTGRRLPPAAGDRRPGPAHRPGPEEAHAEDHHQRAGDFANGQLASIMSASGRSASTAPTARPTTPASSPARRRPIRRPRCWAWTASTCSRPPRAQDTTWRFVTWLLKPDVYHSWAVAGSFRLPVMPAAVKSEEYQRFLKENPQQKPFADQLPGPS